MKVVQGLKERKFARDKDFLDNLVRNWTSWSEKAMMAYQGGDHTLYENHTVEELADKTMQELSDYHKHENITIIAGCLNEAFFGRDDVIAYFCDGLKSKDIGSLDVYAGPEIHKGNDNNFIRFLKDSKAKFNWSNYSFMVHGIFSEDFSSYQKLHLTEHDVRSEHHYHHCPGVYNVFAKDYVKSYEKNIFEGFDNIKADKKMPNLAEVRKG